MLVPGRHRGVPFGSGRGASVAHVDRQLVFVNQHAVVRAGHVSHRQQVGGAPNVGKRPREKAHRYQELPEAPSGQCRPVPVSLGLVPQW